MSVGKWIREGRKAKGWSQAVLGEKVGVTQTLVSQWENGKRVPNEEQRQKMESLFGMIPGTSIAEPVEAVVVDAPTANAAAKPAKKKKRVIESYDHPDKKRVNNPPVGLVTPETDADEGRKRYAYDPHLDPQLVWAGKAEHTSFEVDTVSLHVHERIDPRTIIEAVRKKNGDCETGQLSLFERPEANPPLRDAIQFYKHAHGWSNRLVAGDSLLVMNSLLEKEGMAGSIQMVYMDPPYGVKYVVSWIGQDTFYPRKSPSPVVTLRPAI